METQKLADVKISVIMPVRNMVKYIRECMESLLNAAVIAGPLA